MATGVETSGRGPKHYQRTVCSGGYWLTPYAPRGRKKNDADDDDYDQRMAKG